MCCTFRIRREILNEIAVVPSYLGGLGRRNEEDGRHPVKVKTLSWLSWGLAWPASGLGLAGLRGSV